MKKSGGNFSFKLLLIAQLTVALVNDNERF